MNSRDRGWSDARSLDGAEFDGPARASAAARRRGRPLRVLHLPTSVGGHGPGLAAAERELGADSRCVIYHDRFSRYQVDEVLLAQGDGPLRKQRQRLHLLGTALAWADVVHCNFGRSVMPVADPRPWTSPLGALVELARRVVGRAIELRDLPLLRAAGKAVFVTYQGDDARQGDVCRRLFPIHFVHEVEPVYYTPAKDVAARRRIARADRWAHGLFALNPDLLRVLPPRATYVPYSSVDMRAWTPAVRPAGAGVAPPVVVHAPTHRAVKGTRYVLEAVERLRREDGLTVELVLVEGLTREAARPLYERADLVIDQLLAGYYGGLAVEAMALGRPVACYLRGEDMALLPQAMREEMPLISVTPATLADELRRWLGPRRGELADVGARSRSFVERWHDPLTIARRHLEDYRAALEGRSTAAGADPRRQA